MRLFWRLYHFTRDWPRTRFHSTPWDIAERWQILQNSRSHPITLKVLLPYIICYWLNFKRHILSTDPCPFESLTRENWFMNQLVYGLAYETGLWSHRVIQSTITGNPFVHTSSACSFTNWRLIHFGRRPGQWEHPCDLLICSLASLQVGKQSRSGDVLACSESFLTLQVRQLVSLWVIRSKEWLISQ